MSPISKCENSLLAGACQSIAEVRRGIRYVELVPESTAGVVRNKDEVVFLTKYSFLASIETDDVP